MDTWKELAAKLNFKKKFICTSDLSLFVIKTSNIVSASKQQIAWIVIVVVFAVDGYLFDFHWLKMKPFFSAHLFLASNGTSQQSSQNQKQKRAPIHSACAFHFRLRGHSIANDHVWYCLILVDKEKKSSSRYKNSNNNNTTNTNKTNTHRDLQQQQNGTSNHYFQFIVCERVVCARSRSPAPAKHLAFKQHRVFLFE